MASELPLVLIVEDDQGIAGLVSEILRGEGLGVVVARTPEEATRILQGDRRPAAMVLDLMLGAMEGNDFYRELQARGLAVPAVIVSGRHDGAERAAEIGASFIGKPFDVDHLAQVVRAAAGLG